MRMMDLRKSVVAVGLASILWRGVLAEDAAPRPEWDQKKAVEMVQKVIALEAAGQPWDTIAWMDNPSDAAARAKKESKPIFVFFFLKKNVGPAAAPC